MKEFRRMAYPYFVWSAIMIILPMLLIVMYAFTVKGNDVISFKVTLDNFARFFSDPIFLDVLKRSLWVAVITTVICLVMGYPVAYIISQMKEHSKAIMVLLITMPMWINMLVRTYAWVGILQDKGVINTILGFFGIGPISLIYTDFAVILGMVYNFIPFMILQIYTALSKLDKSYLEAASDLGANKIESFMRITLPLSLPGVLSGITLVFLPAVSSFFIPKMLGGGQYVLIGNVIESQFLTSGNWNFGSAISLIMTIIVMLSLFLTKKLDRTGQNEGGR